MYVKLFSSLYQGTLRGKSDEILVFTNLLAHADQHGIVDKHWKAISEETGLSRERVESAITNLESPDPESRSPEMDGCRIVRMDEHRAWGWQVVNYGKYRAIRSEDDRREQNRLAQEKWRSKQNKPRKPPSAQAEAEGEVTEKKVDARATRLPADWSLPKEWGEWACNERGWNPSHALAISQSFRDFWIAKPGKDGRKLDWLATWRNWVRNQRGNATTLNVAPEIDSRCQKIVNGERCRNGVNLWNRAGTKGNCGEHGPI